MRLSLIAIESRAGEVADVSSAALVDLLWTAATAADRVEHISMRSRPDRIEIGVFSRWATAADAASNAREFVARALAASPVFRRWRPASAADLPLYDL